jgi:ribonucleoside-diphosphate reductase alpha chain
MELAKLEGPYSTFEGSPISQGEFQHNLWNIKDEDLSGRWDWALRKEVMEHGFVIHCCTNAYCFYFSNFRK